VRIGRDEVLWMAVNVGEIATTPAGYEYLLSNGRSAFKHDHASATLAGFDGAHEASGSAAKDDHVIVVPHDQW